MSDTAEELDLSQLGKTDGGASPQAVKAEPSPVAPPPASANPAQTINHYPWTPLPPAPKTAAPIPEITLPPNPVVAALPIPAPPVNATDQAQDQPAAQAITQPQVLSPTAPMALSAAPIDLTTVHTPPAEVLGIQKPTLNPERPHEDVTHLYGFSTQEVWRALRPSKVYGLFLFGSIAVVICLAVFLFQNSGQTLYEVPFIKNILGLE